MTTSTMLRFLSTALLLYSSTLVITTTALDNGLALTPPMGWNSWNAFHCHNITQDLILQQAGLLIALGLAELGYRYVNIDDCWMDNKRTTKEGALVGDPQRFPQGMTWLGDALHERQLQFGIYSSAGTLTCAGYPASLGHEVVDAQTFASWGVDYLKYDNCHNQGVPGIDRYTTMRDALNATGRPILFSLCQWGDEDSWQWARSVGNTWRSTQDIAANWRSLELNFWRSQEHFERSGPGAWLDPDMLEVGNGEFVKSYPENKAHFSLWVMAKAPLLLGNDLRTVTPDVLEIISNTELLAIHQDRTAPQARCVRGCDRKKFLLQQQQQEEEDDEKNKDNSLRQSTRKTTTTTTMTTTDVSSSVSLWPWDKDAMSIFATTLGNGTVAVLFINWDDTKTMPNTTTVNVVQVLGIIPHPNQVVYIRDLWTHEAVYNTNHGSGGSSSSSSSSEAFGFEDLKQVPLPTLLPHDCAVYSFTYRTKQ